MPRSSKGDWDFAMVPETRTPTKVPMPEPQLTRHPYGITAVDTQYVRPGLAAAHIIQQAGRAAFVDVGTTHSVPYLLAALEALGVAREAVDYVFLTHVHLDHAGGAGTLLQALPNAKAVLHPRGSPHLIQPEKLIAASKAVYGEDLYRRLYGEIVPIPAARVVVTKDLQRIALAGREFEFVHTPGHALHHHCIVDLQHAGIFTGDTFGLSYRELDTAQGAFIVPTTTPTQFDPHQLVASIDRLLSYRPESIYLMHYSRVTDAPRLGASLKTQVWQLAEIALRNANAPDVKAAIIKEMRQLWFGLVRQHGCTLPDADIEELLGTDLELNAQGLVVWVERQKRAV
jgi:glyoxylase-like metal-dependent hydrolase (beta-lactamase superfamily II)